MSEIYRAVMRNPQQGRVLLDTIYDRYKPWLFEGHAFGVSVKPAKRSLDQNALLHAMLQHISIHREWAGSKHSVEVWKRLLVAAWFRATGRAVQLLPALDGHGVDIVFAKTSKLSKTECNELLEFIFAWGAANDIQLPARQELEATA